MGTSTRESGEKTRTWEKEANCIRMGITTKESSTRMKDMGKVRCSTQRTSISTRGVGSKTRGVGLACLLTKKEKCTREAGRTINRKDLGLIFE